MRHDIVKVLGNGERPIIAVDIDVVSGTAQNIEESIILDTTSVLVFIQDANVDVVRPASRFYQDQAYFVLGQCVIILEHFG